MSVIRAGDIDKLANRIGDLAQRLEHVEAAVLQMAEVGSANSSALGQLAETLHSLSDTCVQLAENNQATRQAF